MNPRRHHRGPRSQLRLSPWLAVVDARVDGQPMAADRTQRSVALRVDEGGSREVSVTLEGFVPRLPEPDARTAWSGAVAGSGEVGLNLRQADLPIANQPHVPPIAARRWFQNPVAP